MASRRFRIRSPSRSGLTAQTDVIQDVNALHRAKGPAGMSYLAAMIRRVILFVVCVALGIFAGAMILYVHLSRSDHLFPWHTEMLTAEFTAKSSDVRTFADYQRLEDRLFQQLDEKVYAQTATGPEQALVRYSRGSAADPNRREPDWNRSYELPATAPRGGVLLLHGMSDSPYSLRAIGKALNEHGYWVLGLRMPGHGTAPSGMLTVTWEDMSAAVRLGMRHLASKVGNAPIHMLGYSTGAPLAVDYALSALDDPALPAPSRLVLLSPAIGISRAAALARWMDWLGKLPGLETLAWTQLVPEFDPFKYNSFTSNAGYQVHRMTRSIVERIEQRASSRALAGFPSTLVFLSAVDATVSTEAVVDNLLKHLPPGSGELMLFDLNRRDASSTVIVTDPGPLTARLMASDKLPFGLTLLANEAPHSGRVVSRHKPALSTEASVEPLDLAWPGGIISLSHIALPFPPDDPLYGQTRPEGSDLVFLGQIAVQGERGLLLFPADWLLRLRYNPFFLFLESQTIAWLDMANATPSANDAPSPIPAKPQQ
ncbi:MAG: alpha/beta hydrolase [Rhodospirillales bacterium]